MKTCCVSPPSCRIGFVFVVNTEDEIDGASDAGVGFYRLLNYIADEYDLSQALISMVSVSISHVYICIVLESSFLTTSNPSKLYASSNLFVPPKSVMLLCLVFPWFDEMDEAVGFCLW